MAGAYAAAHPERVRKLILENPAGLIEVVHPLTAQFYRLSPQRIVQACGPFGVSLVRRGRSIELGRARCDSDALVDYYYQLTIAPLSGQLAFEQILGRRRWHTPLIEFAEAYTMPVTILWGMQDSLLNVEAAYLFEAAVDRCKVIPMVEAGHSPHNEVPELFHERLDRVVEQTEL
jgi:pimeloyl-ACP methyl ester carboxylesterase